MAQIQEKFSVLLAGKTLLESGDGLFTGWPRYSDATLVRMRLEARDFIKREIQKGKVVAILEDGDPTIYGPLEAYLPVLAELKPRMVPGISSFNAANAALGGGGLTGGHGISNGRKSHSITLAAATDMRDSYTGIDTLEKLSQSQNSVVFFIMRADMPTLAEKLARYYPADTPLAIVTDAGWENREEVTRLTVGTFRGFVETHALPFASLIYIGDFLK
jgi:precorrin-4/cobalt-precorrin-4 C11-methyltransferase